MNNHKKKEETCGKLSLLEESRILDVPIANLNYQAVVDQIVAWASLKERRFVGVCNVHSITSAGWNPMLRKALQFSDLNTADGVPLVWVQRLLGYKQASRVYGPTLMLQVLERACQEKLRVAFYGGHPDRLPLLLKKLESRFAGLNIVEAISPPFHDLTEEEDRDFTERLVMARPDILWVGLGCPKQEEWMLNHCPRIPGVMVGVGAAFDFHAGAVKQASSRIQKLGLEWAFRLYCEPRRLLRRYLTTNPTFLYKVSLQLANRVLFHENYIQPKQLQANSER